MKFALLPKPRLFSRRLCSSGCVPGASPRKGCHFRARLDLSQQIPSHHWSCVKKGERGLIKYVREVYGVVQMLQGSQGRENSYRGVGLKVLRLQNTLHHITPGLNACRGVEGLKENSDKYL